MLQALINRVAGKFGYRLAPLGAEIPPDIAADEAFMVLYCQVRPFTMTSAERLYALYQSVRYVVAKGVEGDFVECGVWRGGSCMMMALTLRQLGAADRRIHLYDTFEGMSEPTEADRQLTGESADRLLAQEDRSDPYSVWCASGIEEVRRNLLETGLSPETFILNPGKVEETLPAHLPGRIALLRLDTDWYESTRHELIHLYPLLQSDGVLIIDDFGHWEGAKKAVLEYFAGQPALLHRIDYTGRCLVK